MNRNSEVLIVLPNGLVVPLPLYTTIVNYVTAVIGTLPRGVALTLERLCGSEFWAALPVAEHTTAGRIVAHLVREGELQLQFVGCKHRTPKVYERR